MAWYHWLNPVKLVKEGYKHVVEPVISPVLDLVSTGWNVIGEGLSSGAKAIFGEGAGKLINQAWTSADPAVFGDYLERSIDKADKLTAIFKGDLGVISRIGLETAIEMSTGSVQNANKMMAWTGTLSSTISEISGIEFQAVTNKLKDVLVNAVAEDLPDLAKNGRVDSRAKSLLSTVFSKIPLGAMSGTADEIEKRAISDRICFAFGIFFSAAGNDISNKAEAGIFCDRLGDWGFFGDFGLANEEERLSAPSLSVSVQVFMVNADREAFKDCKVITVPIGPSGIEAGPIYYKDSDKFVGTKYAYGKGPAIFNKKQEAASSSAQYLVNKPEDNNIAQIGSNLAAQSLMWSAAMDTAKNPENEYLNLAALKGSSRDVFIMTGDGKYLSLSADSNSLESIEKPNNSSIFTISEIGAATYDNPFVAYNANVNGLDINKNSARGLLIQTSNNKFLELSSGFSLNANPVAISCIINGLSNILIRPYIAGNMDTMMNHSLQLFFIPLERKEILLKTNGQGGYDDYLQAPADIFIDKNQPLSSTEGYYLLIKLGSSQVMIQNHEGAYFRINGSQLSKTDKNFMPDASCVFVMETRENNGVAFRSLIGNYYLSRIMGTRNPNEGYPLYGCDLLAADNSIYAAANAVNFYIVDLKGRPIGLRTFYADNPYTAISTSIFEEPCNGLPLSQQASERLQFRFSTTPLANLHLISLGIGANGKERFGFRTQNNSNFVVRHPYDPENLYVNIGGYGNNFEITSEGDAVYIQSAFGGGQYYLAIDATNEDNFTHKLCFSEAKYPWEIIDMKGSFANFNLAIFTPVDTSKGIPNFWNTPKAFRNYMLEMANRIFSIGTSICNYDGRLRFVGTPLLRTENTFLIIKIKDIDENTKIVALKNKAGDFVMVDGAGTLSFSPSLDTLSFFNLCQSSPGIFMLRDFYQRVIGVNHANNGYLCADGTQGYTANNDTATFKFIDPINL